VQFYEQITSLSSGIYIETYEFGKIVSCEILIEEFNKEQLEFCFFKNKNSILLQNSFKYNEKVLKPLKTDSNFTRYHSFEI
jgi:hypothetical protein